MGNEHAIGQNGIVFQKKGQYIVPNKLNHYQAGQQEEIVNNIFGINDPTLLTRSYWAKQQTKQSFQIKDKRSPSQSRFYNDSYVRSTRKHQKGINDCDEHEQERRQSLSKSIVTDSKIDQILIEQGQLRNLSKNTSVSIIHKLNKFDDENVSQSPFKNSQQKCNLRYSKYSKNKENFNYLLGSGTKSHSQNKNQNQKILYQTKISPFKGTQKSIQQSLKHKTLNDITLKSQLSNIFGLQSIQQQKCEQLTDRLDEQLKSMRKTEAEGQKSRLTQRSLKMYETLTKTINKSLNHDESQGDVGFCQQTFSRFEEQNAYQKNFHKQCQIEKSQKQSKKTSSKNINIQVYNGLNEDSQNESLIKVMKRISDLHITNNEYENRRSQKTNKKSLINQSDNSDILYQNKNQQKYRFQDQEGKGYSQKSSKKYSQNNHYDRQSFKFDLKKVNSSDRSQRNQIKSEKQKGKNFTEKQKSLRKITQEQSQRQNYRSKLTIQVNNQQFNTKSSCSNNRCLENEICQTDSSQALDDTYSDKFQLQRNLSPRSLAYEGKIMTRQQSCSGRLVQTSKAKERNKKFDFNKKPYQNKQEQSHEQRSIYSPKNQPQETIKSSKQPIRDYQLLLKIQTLQQEVRRLKTKEELQKFESRRYSPVKQQKIKIHRKEQQRKSSNNQQDQQTKYCINDLSSSKPFKRRLQYFKLQTKQV